MLSGKLISWLLARFSLVRWCSFSKTLLNRQMQGSPTFSHMRLTHNKSADSCRSNASTVSACLTACPSEVAVFCRFAAADKDLQLRSLVNVLQHSTSIMSHMNPSVRATKPHSMLCFDLSALFFTCTLNECRNAQLGFIFTPVMRRHFSSQTSCICGCRRQGPSVE